MIRNLEEYYPKKLGVRYDPPAIIIEYSLVDQQKTMFHKILIPTLNMESQILAAAIRKEHSTYFYKDRITEGNIRKLIEKLKRGSNQNRQSKKQPVRIITDQPRQIHNQIIENKPNDKIPKDPVVLSKAVSEKEISEINQYYDEQFQDFEASQHSKSKDESSHQIQKPNPVFEFLQQEQPSVQIKPSKPPLPSTKSKIPVVAQKKKEAPPPAPSPIIPQVADCFQYL